MKNAIPATMMSKFLEGELARGNAPVVMGGQAAKEESLKG